MWAIPAVLLAVGCGQANAGDPKPKDEKTIVRENCEKQVKSQLKAPATATFPRTAQVERQRTGLYKLNDVVDAQNGFGAKIRTGFECQTDPAENGFKVLWVEFDSEEYWHNSAGAS